MSAVAWIVAAVVAWLLVILAIHVVVVPWLRAQVAGGGDAVTGLLAVVTRFYCILVHRLRVDGLEHVPDRVPPEGLIVVANHTAGIDPLLIQSCLRLHIRWMMLREMMAPQLEGIWRRERIIPVERGSRDGVAARTAIRHVRDGGVLGIFPEGGIARPRGTVRPFEPGVGLIVARTEAPVLLAWVRGTPVTPSAAGSFTRSSHARVTFVELMRIPPRTRPADVVTLLRDRLVEVSGWAPSEQAAESPTGGESADGVRSAAPRAES